MDDVESESPAGARTISGGKFLAQDTVDPDSRSELRPQMMEAQAENRDKHKNHQNRFRALEAFNQKTCFRLIVVLLFCICMFAVFGFYGRDKKKDLQQKIQALMAVQNDFINDLQNMKKTLSWLVGKFNSMNQLIGEFNITNQLVGKLNSTNLEAN